jgi:hypothetical protein
MKYKKIHINDANNAYSLLKRLSSPAYASLFETAILNFTVNKINGKINNPSIIALNKDEYESYLNIISKA